MVKGNEWGEHNMENSKKEVKEKPKLIFIMKKNGQIAFKTK